MQVNRTVPHVEPAPAFPSFSTEAAADEISRARVFGEPLVPLAEPTPRENQALAQAILAGLQTLDITERLAIFEAFLRDHPSSAWRASLLGNLGVLYRRNGYFTRAETALREAWTLSKDGTTPEAKAVAIAALGELLDIYTRFGRLQRMDEMLAQAEGREIWGSPAERLREARMGSWILHNAHNRAVPSGPRALASIRAFLDPGAGPSTELEGFHADEDGATLSEMQQLARRTGLGLQMARRTGKAALPLPAMMHFKVGHFSAVLKQEGDRFLVNDDCLGGEIWMSAEALAEESSGYFLIPSGPMPSGWEKVKDEAAESIRGKCAPGPSPNGESTCPCNIQNGGPGGASSGMAVYSFHSLLASLHIEDRPVNYSPPRGPAVSAFLSYNQRESYKPLTYTFTNMGTRWNVGWVTWIEDDPTNPNASVYSHLAGGGRETATGLVGSSFVPHRNSQAVITRTSTSPIRYERVLPDGSKEVYSQADGAQSAPRRVFLTQFTDPQGNALTYTYDAQLRLVSVTDAIGQVTTLSYELVADPFKVTKITDPFGRAALLRYDASRRLIDITDPIGIQSQFEYGDQEGFVTGDFVRALTTPYGTTTFRGTTGVTHMTDYGVEATDPLGGRELIQFIAAAAPVPDTDPASSVPTGFSARNSGFTLNSSFYFDKRAMLLHPGDYTKALAMKWNSAPTGLWDSFSAVKKPLEGRVWYAYPQEPATGHSVGPVNKPVKIARVLDDGTSQIYRYEYNSLGQVTRQIDPLGRETIYEYDASGIDLLRTKQRNAASPGGYDLLETRTYNALHDPLTVTDAAGQTTTYTYNAAGQILTMVTPLRSCPGCGSENRTTTWSYDTNNYLQSITLPATGATLSFTYDSYGRVRTIMDEDGYVLTSDHDALDRPTRTTYPDGTYEETVYSRLDVEKRRDRLGRWSHATHDALRRPVAIRDPLGRTINQQWCTCGSLDKLIDAGGNATSWERDLQGRMTRESRADGSFGEYVYEATTSRLKIQKDAKGQEARYAFFGDDRIQQISYPNAQIATPSVSYTYESAYPRLATMVDGVGTTTYPYHPVTAPPTLGASRLASVDGPFSNDTVSYGYDELGRVVSRTVNGVTTTWAFDALGRLTTLGDPIGSFAWAYVGVTGRVNSLTYPNGQTTSYGYLPNTGDKHLQEIHHRASAGGATLSKFTYGYDAVGNVTLWTQQDGATAANAYDLSYDRADQLGAALYRTTDPQPVTRKRYAWAYDPAGNRTTEQIDDAPMLSSFDNRNRLMTQQPGGALMFKGGLNEAATVTVGSTPALVAADNKFQGTAQVSSGTSDTVVVATDPAGNVRTNTYRVAISGSTKSYTYDANGSLTAEGTETYEWDGANRLVRVLDNAAEIARFVYDGQGHRAQKIVGGVTRTYVYSGEDILEERPSAGATVRHVHGPGIDQPLARIESGATSYYLADHLGSIAQMTNASATVTLTRQYDAWGNLIQGATAGGYAFTGREWDPETGLYYYRARYYDSRAGRFLSEDPAGLSDGGNRYRYVANNPLRYVDPSGEVKWQIAWKTDYWSRSDGQIDIKGGSIDWVCRGECGRYRVEFTVKVDMVMHISARCPEWSLTHETRHALQFTTNIMRHAGPPLRDAESKDYSSKPECDAAATAAASKAKEEVKKHLDDGQWKINIYVPCLWQVL